MKASDRILIISLALFSPLAYTDHGNLEFRVDDDASVPTYRVSVGQANGTVYDNLESASSVIPYEYRGRCGKGNLHKFEVNDTNISVNTSNESLTGNKGHDWGKRSVNEQPSNDILFARCNDEVQRLMTNGSTLKQALNSQKVIDVELNVLGILSCKKKVGFDPAPMVSDTEIPAKIVCDAANYLPPLGVNQISLSVTPIDSNISGVCKLDMTGGIQTNLLDINETSRNIKYRYVYESNGFSYQKSGWFNGTANTGNYGNVALNFVGDVPNNSEALQSGKIFVEVDTGSGQTVLSAKKSYSMNCQEDLDLQLDTFVSPKVNIEVKPVQATKEWRQNQWCPTEARVIATVTAGSEDINAQARFIGEVFTDIQLMDVALASEANKKYQVKKTLVWPTSQNTLALNNNAQPQGLDSTEITQRFNLVDQDNKVLASVPLKVYTVPCWEPAINKNLVGSSDLGMLPDHTGGGGAPTALVDTSSNNPPTKPTTAPIKKPVFGKRVQELNTKDQQAIDKGKQLLTHELSHTVQGGQADKNTGNQINDSRDKYANAETSNRQSTSVPTEEVTLAYEKIEVTYAKINIDGKTYNQVKGKEGDRCNQAQFKSDSLVLKRGRPLAVECIDGKIKRSGKLIQTKDSSDANERNNTISSGVKPNTSTPGQKGNAILSHSAPAIQKGKMKCRRVSRRVSVCGSTNFKNRVSGGVGIHFSQTDRQTGDFSIDPATIEQETKAKKHIYITEDVSSCRALANDRSFDKKQAQELYKSCQKSVVGR